MKKKILSVIALLLVLVTVLTICFCRTSKSDPVKVVEKELSIDLKGFEVDLITETHGGFLGDGETYYILVSRTDDEFQMPTEHWQSLPMTDELNSVIYGSESRLYDVKIPKVENGYYCFIDRSNYDENNRKIYNYKNLTPKSFDLLNFTLAIYDTDNVRFYYYELDT